MNSFKQSFHSIRWVGVVLVTILMIPGSVWSYSGGPPDGVAGDPPGNADCTQCHSQFAVNSGSGTLSLLDLPTEYRPDSTYLITITLQDAAEIWGFEMTSILASGDQGGTLAAVDTYVQISEGAGTLRDYAKQTTLGNFRGQASATWELNWTAPTAGAGAVDFYLAGNAGDRNGNTQGDYIYTLSSNIPEEILGIEKYLSYAPESAALVSAYPNPFNPLVTVNLQNLPAGQVALEILNLNGQTLWSSKLDANGSQSLNIPLNLAAYPSGQYFIRAHHPGGVSVVPIIKVK